MIMYSTPHKIKESKMLRIPETKKPKLRYTKPKLPSHPELQKKFTTSQTITEQRFTEVMQRVLPKKKLSEKDKEHIHEAYNLSLEYVLLPEEYVSCIMSWYGKHLRFYKQIHPKNIQKMVEAYEGKGKPILL